MTVTSSTARNSYFCNNSQTVFPYTFRILDQAHLQVVLRDEDGNETVLTLTTHYTVSSVGETGGGNVTTVATYDSGYTIVITRSVPVEQLTDYVENDAFPADSHEDALDKLTMIIQQIKEELERCIKVPVSSSLSGDAIEIDVTASKAIGWDAYGTGLALYNTTEVYGAGQEYFDLPTADLASRGIVTRTLTAGENLSFGNLVYRKSDGKFWKVDADAAATMPAVAMALESISADATGSMLMLGWAKNSSWTWTVGGLLYASTTAGAITQTAPSGTGDQVQVVGWAYSATLIFFNPDYTLVEIV